MIAMAAGDDHISAGFGESTSERLAQAAACAGHDGNAAAKMEEFAHEKLPGRRTTFMRLGSRIFAGLGACTLQANLARDDFLQRKTNFGRYVADKHDRAALANAVDTVGNSGVEADSLQDNIGAAAIGERQDLRGGIGIRGKNRRTAEAGGKLKAR